MPKSIITLITVILLFALYLPSSAKSAQSLNAGDYKPLVYLDGDKRPVGSGIKSIQEDKEYIDYRKLDEPPPSRHDTIFTILSWGIALLGGALLIAVAFVITLAKIVKRKTEGMKRYSRELENREEQFRLAMMASRDGLWDWNVLNGEFYFSPGYFRIIGYEADELQHEFSTWADRIHPDDYDNTMKANTECMEGITESFSVEFRMLAKSGDWIWILGRGAAVERREDGRATRIIGTHTDITSLVEVRNRLRDSEERLKLATSAAHMGVWDWNLLNNTLIWDDREFEIYGVNKTSPSLTKKIWEGAIHEDDRSETFKRFNSAFRLENFYETGYRIVRPDDSVRTIKSFGTIIRENGSAIRIIGVDIDVTNQLMLEQQIRHTQKMDAVGRLAGGIAHDFNNKLTVILGYSELMRMFECATESRCDQYLEEIVKAAQHSQEITRKLLAFSRDESVESCRIDINSILSEMERTLGRLIGEQTDIHFELSEGLWPVRMNATEYDQIIMNLVVNARDAMPDGGRVVISTANETVENFSSNSCMNAAPGDYTVTSVCDSGCGVSRELIDRIFDPFFTTKPAGKGTGLGLSTVYGIVSRCKGFVTVDSEPGKGSSFRVYLPRFNYQSEETSPVEEMAEIRGGGIILLVEDEEAVRDMTRLFLESIGYRVIVADTPMHAAELCEDSELKIDCVLSDVIMPEMNGNQLKERISALRPELPFIFMSGYTSDILTEQGVAEQGLHFIRKPLNFKSLHDKLALLIGNSAILPEMPGSVRVPRYPCYTQ
jgi:PAS domain S-box-containing protein